MPEILRDELKAWCAIPAAQLAGHAGLKAKFRMVKDSAEMGRVMAAELVDTLKANNAAGRATRAIIPCGPTAWYRPWGEMVNADKVSLANFHIFHMDECLDWQARPVPKNHPYNFRTYMEANFYGPIAAGLNVPEAQRHWLLPETLDEVRNALAAAPVDLTLGGWGQDGHIA